MTGWEGARVFFLLMCVVIGLPVAFAKGDPNAIRCVALLIGGAAGWGMIKVKWPNDIIGGVMMVTGFLVTLFCMFTFCILIFAVGNG